MNNVAGYEPVADDGGASSSSTTMAVVWPASRLSPVAGHVGVKFGQTLLVWGGYYHMEEEDDDGALTLFEGYRSPTSLFVYPAAVNDGCSPNKLGPRNGEGDVWIEVKAMEGDVPPKNSGACAVLCNRKLIVFGGFTDRSYGASEDRSLNLLYELDLSTLQWKRVPYRSYSHEELKAEKDIEKVPTPRHKMVGWEWDGKAYFFGGFGPLPSICSRQFSFLTDHAQFTVDPSSSYALSWNNQLLCYDPNAFWSAVPCGGTIPSPRAAAVVVKLTDRNQVLLFGGRHNDLRLNDIFLLDMTSFVWTEITISSMVPQGRSWMSMARVDQDRLIMYGGFSNDLTPLSDAWELDTTRWEWRQLPDSLSGKGRLWHVGTEIDGNAYVYGGVQSNILSQNEVCQYCSDMLILPFKPRTLVEQCLNQLCRSYGSVLLENRWLIEQLPRDVRVRIEKRSALLQDARTNQFKARPVPSTAITSFADILAL
uniref:Uncharacterized protein n=1 Tax=Plectus sambesii TaxID=2011161 RepID=A0A914V185_9BILA